MVAKIASSKAEDKSKLSQEISAKQVPKGGEFCHNRKSFDNTAQAIRAASSLQNDKAALVLLACGQSPERRRLASQLADAQSESCSAVASSAFN